MDTIRSGERMQEKNPIPTDPNGIIKDFSTTTCSAATYLNNHLSSTTSIPDLQISASGLLGILEHASQTASQTLEILIDEMLRLAPRLGYEIELFKADLHSLSNTIDGTVHKKKELEANHAGDRLCELSEIKTKMERGQHVMREARAWSPPVERIEVPVLALIRSKDYDAASAKIEGYEKLVHVWAGTREYEVRKSVVDRLRRVLLDCREDDERRIRESLDGSSRVGSDGTRGSDSMKDEKDGYYGFIRRGLGKYYG